ncbi:hypothetical protein T01_3385 [Trichinella spiralis]|uniref:Uncharacterized protein n=1 Tax=Trichinella spiralis TaxID=6334 RepID=A0A0V1AJS3_TRISP|nr:hypothetical protein T01_3385 [Trichinella spiralis]
MIFIKFPSSRGCKVPKIFEKFPRLKSPQDFQKVPEVGKSPRFLKSSRG